MSMRSRIFFVFLAIFVIYTFTVPAFSADKVEKYIPDMVSGEEGMTLWQIIKSGGEVMIVLALLSIVGLALVVYYFMIISQEKLIPAWFLDRMRSLMGAGKFEEAKVLCNSSENLISDIVLAGLSKKEYGKTVVEDAMQDNAKRGLSVIWQKLSYLADIAAIAPMVGLLGTVLGMIQAFNVIAFQTGAVKPILLASGISKAMVTTATGLILAIPAMLFYSYFRGVLQNVTFQYEHISSELLQLIAGEDNERVKKAPRSRI